MGFASVLAMIKKSSWIGLALLPVLIWVRPSIAESCYQSVREAGSHIWEYKSSTTSGCGIGCSVGFIRWSAKTRMEEGYQVKDSTVDFDLGRKADTTVQVKVYPFSVSAPNETYCGDPFDSLAFEGDSVFFNTYFSMIVPNFIFSKRLGLIEWRKGFLSSHGNGESSYNRLLTYDGDSLGIQRMLQAVRFVESGVRPAGSAKSRRSINTEGLPPGVVRYRMRAHSLSGKLLPE
jgi:hypothetical protein